MTASSYIKNKKALQHSGLQNVHPLFGHEKLASHSYVEVDHFRVEYASLILFDEMNQLRDRAIKKSEAIRLSKLSTALLSPYCQLYSKDINSD
ncbi:hypothetical protein Ahy_A07g032663 [Arachis hypogaea]|uniref:Uncharacterized protein n=1 Tax=Arachis hypogaea TaxID=3818 RepID=A0A445C7H5_ARAHY|nr:hypothetical protein Ahy_A07g032663 [Arachis hypogaea]